MRILHADTDDIGNPLRGGQPVRTYEVNTRLAARHDITVLTATYPGCERRVRRGALAYRRLGVTLPGLGLSPHLSFLASLGPVLRRTPHDLVVEEFTPPVGFSLLPLWTRKPVVCIVQWFSFDSWERRYRLPLERIMRAACARGRYANFIVQTRKMGEYFKTLNPEARIWTVGCGVNDDAFAAPGRSGDYALYLGRLDVEHKGLDLLIQAWAALRDAGHLIPLRMVGEGPGRGYVEREVARLGLGPLVTLSGRLEGAPKAAALRDCRFMVMPSRSETFGIVALEAMAASKPVVAFDVDHLNEVLRPQWAVLLPPFGVAAFAGAVARLWADPDGGRALGERAFEAARLRRWDTIAEQQDAVYEAVGGGRGTQDAAQGAFHGR